MPYLTLLMLFFGLGHMYINHSFIITVYLCYFSGKTFIGQILGMQAEFRTYPVIGILPVSYKLHALFKPSGRYLCF